MRGGGGPEMKPHFWVMIGVGGTVALGGAAVASAAAFWYWSSASPRAAAGTSEGRDAARVFATSRHVTLATAPSWISETSLGRPVDENFNPLQGSDGAPLFSAASPHRTELNAISHSFTLIETDLDLKANAAGWGIGSVELATSQSRSFATYRAFEDKYALDIDDSAGMRPPPPGGVYYVWRVHFGHLYEVVASGRSDVVNAQLKTDFVAGHIGVAADFKRRGLTVEAKGRGLKAKSGEAIFAKTQEEIEDNYEASGLPVPIFVEYTTIPNVAAPSERRVVATTVPVTVKFTEIRIYKDGTWFSSKWTANADCEINGRQHPLENPVVLDKKVRDSSEKGPRGPSGKEFFGRYTLEGRFQFEVPVGASLRCGLSGKIDDGKRVIPAAQFPAIRVAAGAATKRGSFQSAAAGDAEYVVDYSVEFGEQ